MARATQLTKVRAFESDVLERLSRVHPAVPLFVWGPVAAFLAWLGHRRGLDLAAVAGLGVAGLVLWTFAEYVLHRWLFHWEPRDPQMRRRIYLLHQLHHDVQEWDRLVAPPLLAVPFSLLFLGLFWALLGSPAVFPFFSGFLVGYLLYDYIHFYTHFGRPRTRIGKGLRRRHLQHHFACHDRWYGVSSPLWDHVFRTHVPRGAKPAQR